jgi:hypothetical protein
MEVVQKQSDKRLDVAGEFRVIELQGAPTPGRAFAGASEAD